MQHGAVRAGSFDIARPDRGGMTSAPRVAVALRSNRDEPAAMSHPLMLPMILGVQHELQAAGVAPVLVTCPGTDGCGAAMASSLRTFDPAAVVVAADMHGESLAAIADHGKPTVWLDCARWDAHNCLHRDERGAGAIVASVAAQAGYQRLLVTSLAQQQVTHHSHSERCAGVLTVAEREGLSVEPFEMNDEAVPEVIASIISTIDPATAIICIDYYRLEWIYSVMLSERRATGVDFGLLCCDDAPPMHRLITNVTRASFPRPVLGRKAGSMALRLIERPDEPCPSFVLESTLIRGSTAPGPPRRAAA